MSSIDKRIVQMQFDNQNFESGVKTTMSTLQKLNEKLKMKGSTDGLDEVNKGINKLSSSSGLSGLSSGVETVTSKFSALGIIGMTALANITNSAVNAGKNLVKSFAIDPIIDGFNEYELKMNSIQTILTNTAKHGTTLEDVNSALNELNEYSDKTIYNFAQMTDNIGKATAAGLSLDQAVTFVKGMSNAAAGFGVDATRMAGATYQMTQALSAGVVKLQDWRSMEQAGMGGEMIQEEMYKAAESLGVFVDKSIPFRESLESGWLTAEVFTEAMNNMANDPSLTAAASNVTSFTKLLGTLKETIGSGWAQSFEHIFGNKDESTALWTGISEAIGGVINKSAEARNKMLKDWSDLGGRNAMIRGFTNIFESLGKGFKAIGSAWKEVFPSWTGAKLTDLSTKFRDFTYKIKMSDETAQKIKNTFKGVFDVFDTVKDSVFKLISGFTPLTGLFKGIGQVALNAASGIGRFASNIANAIQNSNIFGMIANGLKTAFTWSGDIFKGVGDGISKFFDNLGGMDFSKAFGGIGKAMAGVGAMIKPVLDGMGEALGSFNFDTLFNILKSAAGIEILKTVKGMFGEISDVAESAKGVFSSLKGIGGKIKETLDGAREALESWQQNLQAGTLLKIAGAIAILAGSLLLLSSIDGKKMLTGLAGMSVIFAELALAYIAISKFGGGGLGFKMSGSLLSMATSLLILAVALKVLSSIKIGEMITGLVGLAVVLGTMSIAVNIFDTKAKNLKKTASSLIIFGAALIVMAGALKLLGSINAEELGGGLVAMAGVLAELALFLAAAKYGSLSVTTAAGVLILSAALLVLQHALGQFGKLDTNVIVTGLAAMAGVLAEILIFDKLSGSGLGMVATAAGVAAMSASMLIMSAALKSLGAIQWEEMARGLVAMAGGLAILGVASTLISGGQMALLGVGIGVMSVALMALSLALKSMGSMSWEEIGKGLLVLAGSLTILAVAMYAMTGAVVGALAMVVMAGALALLTPQLILLGQMDLAGVGIMLLALAGAFTVIGLAGLLLTPVVPTLILLAAAIALLGVGCMACGAGLTAVGTGLGLIGAAIGGSGLLIVEFLRQLIDLLPQLGTKAVEAFANFVGGLTSAVPQLISGFTAIITALLTAIGTMIPQIVQTGLDIAVAFAQGLATAIPQLVTAGMELVVGVLEGIANNIGQIVEAAADIVINFMDGIANKLPEVIESGINLALSFIEGIAEGLNNNQERLEAAMESVIDAIIQAGLAAIKGSINGFKSGGKELLDGLVAGVKSMWESAKSAVKGAIDRAKEAASNLGSSLVQAGRDLISGLKKGIEEKAEAIASAARKVAEKAVNAVKNFLGIASPSKVFMQLGRYVDEGFAKGLEKNAGMVDAPMRAVGQRAVDNMTSAIRNISNLSEIGMDFEPTITPVLDLSNIQEGSKTLNSMLQNNDALALNANATGAITRSVGRIQNGNTNNDVVKAVKDLQKSINNINGNTYQINGITYDDGSNVQSAIETLIRAAMIERRM